MRHDQEIGGFENEVERGRGSRKKIHKGWSDTEYHGIFEFHRTIDGDYCHFSRELLDIIERCDTTESSGSRWKPHYVSLDAKFTDGQLVEITRND